MRPSVILFTIFFGGIVYGAVFFIFGYPVEVETGEYISRKKVEADAQAFLLSVAETNYSPVRDFNVPEPVVEAGAAALFDVESGRPLFSKNINKIMPIASVTKLMTAIIVLEHLSLDDVYTVSVENVNVDGFGADLYKNERLRGIDLFKMMLIKSSNDAALTFATEAQRRGISIVDEMNKKARELGMYSTRFSDPAGLADNDGFSTASDLVKLVSYASGYGQISEILTTVVEDVISADGAIKHHLLNTNQLLGKIAGIILGKTGYTDVALGTMVLEVDIGSGNGRVISVILGSNDRFGETAKLIEWGKKAYSWK